MAVKGKRTTRKNQNQSKIFLDKLWELRFIIALALLQGLSSVTTFGGMLAISGSYLVATLGMSAVQILFAASWHELLRPEENDSKRKSYFALATLGVACLCVSGFFSSIGFYQTTKLEGAKIVDVRNYNNAEIGKAKDGFTLVVQQGQKNADGEIKAKKEAIQSKTDEIKNSTSKSAQNALRKEIKAIETEIKSLEDLKTELAEANYSETINSVKLENSNQVANAIEIIRVETQKIARKGNVEITSDLLKDLSYHPLAETDAEGIFFQKLLAGDASILVVCVIGFGIDFASIFALYGNRRTRILEESIKQNKAWFWRIIKAIFSWEKAETTSTLTTNAVEETATEDFDEKQEVNLLLKNAASGKSLTIKLNVDEISEAAVFEKMPKVLDNLKKRGETVDFLLFPKDWLEMASNRQAIPIQLGKEKLSMEVAA